MSLTALRFPPIAELLEWPGILFDGTAFELNKVGLIYLFALVAPVLIFYMAKRRYAQAPAIAAPRGIQTVAETSVEFVRESIVMQTIGPDGLRYLPFLLSIFFFVFFANITEVIRSSSSRPTRAWRPRSSWRSWCGWCLTASASSTTACSAT